MFVGLSTPRLLIRALRREDAAALHDWRNDPLVARHQAWTLPFPRERSDEIVTTAIELGGPTDGQWWTAGIEHRGSASLLGELVVNLTNGARTAEVGYTLRSSTWRRGYATEGLDALVDWLFASFPLSRVWGGLHPDNAASARVLEQNGFLFEGHTRLSFWLGEDNSDSWLYGLTRADRRAWRERPTEVPRTVRLVPVTAENRDAVLALSTHHSQRAFVAPVWQSLAEAFLPDVENGSAVLPWLRAIEADGVLVGFVMMALPSPAQPEPYLWRLLIDRMHQRRRVAARALALVVEHCRARGDRGLVVSWSEGVGSPRPFYLAHGFVPTGRTVDGETQARLPLA